MTWLGRRWFGRRALWHTDGTAKPFLEHLEDLRLAILRSAAALAIGMAVALPFAPKILNILKAPLAKVGKDPAQFLRVLEVSGPFLVAMGVTFWSGLLFSFPFIVFFVGGFIFPGLTERERKAVLKFSGIAVVLFAVGVCLGYFFVLPAALKAMLGIGEWMRIAQKDVLVTDYVSFVLMMLIGFGLAFELPVVIVVLGYLGIVTSRQLRDKRRHAIIGCLVAAAVLTPSTDVISQLIMGVPMIVLYEVCIWIVWFREKRGRMRAET